MSGKGSAPRPFTDRKQFEENWNAIFGDKQKRGSQDSGQSERRKVRTESPDTDGAESYGGSD